MDNGQWRLLLKRPHRRHLWRAAFGTYLFGTLAAGGVHAVPRWIEVVVNLALFFLALWLVFSAGYACHRSLAKQGSVETHQPTWTG